RAAGLCRRSRAAPGWIAGLGGRASEGGRMKLLSTVRLEPSELFVFGSAAEPGEWAVSGAFVFANADPATLAGKARAEFRAGLLGIASLGWSTLAQIVEASEDDRRAATEQLAKQLVAHFGAPGIAEAVAPAQEETAFPSSLGSHPADTLVADHPPYENRAIPQGIRPLAP